MCMCVLVFYKAETHYRTRNRDCFDQCHNLWLHIKDVECCLRYSQWLKKCLTYLDKNLELSNSLNTHIHTHQTQTEGKAEWFIHEEVLGEIGCAPLPYKGGFIEWPAACLALLWQLTTRLKCCVYVCATTLNIRHKNHNLKMLCSVVKNALVEAPLSFSEQTTLYNCLYNWQFWF